MSLCPSMHMRCTYTYQTRVTPGAGGTSQPLPNKNAFSEALGVCFGFGGFDGITAQAAARGGIGSAGFVFAFFLAFLTFFCPSSWAPQSATSSSAGCTWA